MRDRRGARMIDYAIAGTLVLFALSPLLKDCLS
jgi:hypothetical protein